MNNFTQMIFTTSRKFLNGINPTFILLVSLLFTSFSYGQVSVTTTTPITQNFDGLSSTASVTWSNNTSPLAGWYSTTTTLNPNTGTTNSNNVYNCGTASATDRALGALSTATTHNFGIRLKNNNANAITSLLVSYNGEQWRQNATSQTLVFEYQIGTTVTAITGGTWTAVTALDFVSPNTGTAGALDGNLTANRTAKSATISLSVPAGSEIMLRWTKTGSNSHLLAVDDLSITPTFLVPAITSFQSGNWSATTTWVGGVVPTSANNAVIASSHVVVMDSGTYATRNAGTTTTVDAGGTLATSQTYVNNGTTTINGSFRLDSGGWVSDAGGTNALVYGTNGTLIFNTAYSANNGNYWPTTNGPVNVTVNSGSNLNLGFSRTVTGTFQTAAGVTLSSSTLTLNGICQLNSGGFFNNSPTYGTASTLVYNTSYGVYNEWTGNGAAGVGIPANVRVQSGTLTLTTSNRGIPGNMTIDSTCSLVLNGTSGDLYIGGNWNNSGTFTPNGRAVFFNGAANQTITNASGETFNYLINNKSAGNLILANNVTVNASSGSPLQILNAGAIDLNGKTLTLSNNGGNIQVTGAARSITSSVAGGIVSITGTKTVTSTSSGTLTLGTNVTTSLKNGINFGASLTTIEGKLQVNVGGYVISNAPIYAATSTLEYNSVTGYGVNNEWTGNATTAGVGTPQNVTLTNSSVNLPNAVRSLAGNLTIGASSTLNMNGAAGADMNIGGNWNNAGTFNPNNRLVIFRGASAQSLTGATTFDYLKMDNSAGLTLNNSITNTLTLDLTSGNITLGTNNLTIGSAGTVINASATSYVRTNSTGQFKRTVGASATLFPTGNSAYNPITFNNSGTSDVYGVRVEDGALTTALVNTKTINRKWITTELVVGGSNLSVVAQYNTGEPNTSYDAGTNPYIGFYNGFIWSQVAATLSSYPYTATSTANSTPSDLTSGTQYFAVGKDNAFESDATHLVFVNVPSTGNVNVNLVAFKVEARRSDNSLDTAFTGSVTIIKASGPGNLAGTVTVTAVAGVATFNTAKFDAIGTYTLTTTSGVLTPDTSGTIVVSIAPIVLAAWDLFGQSSPATFEATTFDSTLDNTSTLSYLTRGSGATSSSGSNSFRTTGFQNDGISTSNTDYFQTTLKTDNGYSLSLSLITANLVGTSTFSAAPGVSNQFAYSLDGSNFTLINSPVIVSGTTPAAMPSIDLSGISALQNISSGTTVYFRFYASGQTATGGWGFSSPTSGTNGLAYNGNILCVEPLAYAVTGGGNGCATTGVAVGLANSQVGVSYQLKIGGTNTGSPVAGTGSAISFGNQLAAGTYTVEAFNTNGTCNLTLAMTGSVVVTLDPASVAGTVSVNQTICENTQPTDISLTGNTGTIQWESSTDNSTFTAISGETAATLAGATIGNLTATTYYRAVVTSGTCSSTTSSVVIITVTPSVAASVTIAAVPSGAICSGTSVTFTATPTNGGATPTYQWKVNGTDVSGETASTFTSSTLSNGNVVTVVMTSNANCVTGSPATSAGITMSVSNLLDFVNTQYPGSGTICLGSALTAFGQVYEPGVTPGFQTQGLGIEAEFGYSTSNTNPDTWTNWFAATFNAANESADRDEYMYNFTPSSAGTYYYAFKYRQGNCDWQYGGYHLNAGGTWDGTTNVSGVLTVNETTATISSTNGPSVCPNSDATFTITGTAGAEVSYLLNLVPGLVTLTGGTATITVTGATTNQTLTLVSVTNGVCSSLLVESETVYNSQATTWDGAAWDNGAPTPGMSMIIDGAFDLNSNYDVCSTTITTDGILTVKSGNTLTVQNAIENNGEIIVENTASLVQVNDAAVNSGTGVNKMEKNTTTYYPYDYIYWSSPVDGANLGSVFSTANGFTNYKYKFVPEKFKDVAQGGAYPQVAAGGDGYDDGEGAGPDDWTPASGTMTPGLGYIVLGKGSTIPFNSNATYLSTLLPSYEAIFTGGKFNNGLTEVVVKEDDYNNDFTAPTPAPDGNSTWNLNLNFVGNPYPSAIDIAKFFQGNSGVVNNSLYVWTHDEPITTNAGPNAYDFNNLSFITVNYNPTTQAVTQVASSTNKTLSTNHIASGQGFMVSVENDIAANTKVKFNNGMRTVGNNNTFFRMQDSNIDRLWLNMTGTDVFRQLAVVFHSSSSDTFILGEDTPKIDSANDTEFYSTILNNNGHFAIQSIGAFEENKQVPIGMEINQSGNYSIELGNFEGIFSQGQAIYLEDTYQDVIHDLGTGAYTFSQTAGVNINDRFILRFTNSALGNEDTTLSQVKIYPNPSTGVFYINYAGSEKLTYTIYDLTGKKVLMGTGTVMDLSTLNSGIYTAQISNAASVKSVKLIRE
jgi:hypothetical protein